MLFSVTMVPIGGSDSLAEPVSEVVRVIDDAGLDYQLTGMDTVIEGEWDEVIPVIRRAQERLREDYPRVYTTVAIDDHEASVDRMKKAVEDVEKRVGRSHSR